MALLRRAGEAATARLGEVSAAKEALEGRVAELERAGEERLAEAARREAEVEAERAAESERLHRILDEIEADHAAGSRTVAELRQGLADIHGIGAELGEKLISVVSERNEILARLEVADGALAASAADRRRLERELEASAAAAEELRREKDKGLSNVEELQKVGTSFFLNVLFHPSFLLARPSESNARAGSSGVVLLCLDLGRVLPKVTPRL